MDLQPLERKMGWCGLRNDSPTQSPGTLPLAPGLPCAGASWSTLCRASFAGRAACGCAFLHVTVRAGFVVGSSRHSGGSVLGYGHNREPIPAASCTSVACAPALCGHSDLESPDHASCTRDCS